MNSYNVTKRLLLNSLEKLVVFLNLDQKLHKFFIFGVILNSIFSILNCLFSANFFNNENFLRYKPFFFYYIFGRSSNRFHLFETKRPFFQKNLFVKYQIFPTFFLFVVKIELLLTKKPLRGFCFSLLAHSVLFLILYMEYSQIFILKVLGNFINALFFIMYPLFRTYFTSQDLQNYNFKSERLDLYQRIYENIQGTKISYNRNLLILVNLCFFFNWFKVFLICSTT